MIKLYIDDVRDAPDPSWIVLRTPQEAIDVLAQYQSENVTIGEIMFDHDLGYDEKTGEEWTIRPVVLWMIENEYYPRKASCHSANPWGRKWVQDMIDDFFG